MLKFQNAKSLFERLKLIYSGFRGNIFGKHLMGNRSGGEKFIVTIMTTMMMIIMINFTLQKK